jgi:lysyl-tRNA synthetase class 2
MYAPGDDTRRPRWRATWMPMLAGWLAGAVGLLNLGSALTPDFAARVRVLVELEPSEFVPLAHWLALPSGIALLVAARYLSSRWRRAWQAAVWLLLVLGVLNLVKGLDYEEAVISWGLAAFLFWGRSAFYVERNRPRELPSPELRRAAHGIVRGHGSDTLSFFKLRSDQHYLFSADRRAFLSYRVEGGVLLVAGDPVGPDDAVPNLIRELRGFAEVRGLKVAMLGTSEAMSDLGVGLGLRSFYLGDEAVVDLDEFSLEGRAIRKVRQSVSRLEREGYTVELVSMASLTDADVAELEGVRERWLDGDDDVGFAMAMDGLRGPHLDDSLAVVARDSNGAARGYLHLVPAYARPTAISLSRMCRDPDTPNGLTEFTVARAIEMLRERGYEELSLNFAVMARMMHRPSSPSERVLGRLVALANPFFQIESLYRFNAKFSPRWEPRFIVYEGPFGLPRAALAAMRAEGQLPRLKLRALSR